MFPTPSLKAGLLNVYKLTSHGSVGLGQGSPQARPHLILSQHSAVNPPLTLKFSRLQSRKIFVLLGIFVYVYINDVKIDVHHRKPPK